MASLDLLGQDDLAQLDARDPGAPGQGHLVEALGELVREPGVAAQQLIDRHLTHEAADVVLQQPGDRDPEVADVVDEASGVAALPEHGEVQGDGDVVAGEHVDGHVVDRLPLVDGLERVDQAQREVRARSDHLAVTPEPLQDAAMVARAPHGSR